MPFELEAAMESAAGPPAWLSAAGGTFAWLSAAGAEEDPHSDAGLHRHVAMSNHSVR